MSAIRRPALATVRRTILKCARAPSWYAIARQAVAAVAVQGKQMKISGLPEKSLRIAD